MKRASIAISLFTVLLFSCDIGTIKKGTSNPMLQSLYSVQNKAILFGHQDDLAYGMNWKYKEGESDVKRVSGDYPAVFGWDLGGMERGDLVNLDSVPFNKMKEFAVEVNQMGGINTFSWHPYSPINGVNSWNTETDIVKHLIPDGSHHNEFVQQLDKIAAFFHQLEDNGESFSFIFRPWHEMNGSWFWWGVKNTSTEEYKKLFRFTIEYLRNTKGLKNMLVCYSPNGGYQTEEEYLKWYPGDDLVDILGVDEYDWNGTDNWEENTKKYLSIMIKVAKAKEMPAVFSETGNENLRNSLWFTEKLAKVLEPDSIANNLAYVLVWRNDPKVHHFFSYEGHSSEESAKAFLMQPDIWLLGDYIKYQKKN